MAIEDKASHKIIEPLDIAQKLRIAGVDLFAVIVQFSDRVNIDMTFLDPPNIDLKCFNAFLKDDEEREFANAEMEDILRVQHLFHLRADHLARF